MASLREERWAVEARYFDSVADRIEVKPVDPLNLARYAHPPSRPLYSKELRFSLLGDLAGKKVLDVGCGDGANSMLLGKLGAEVTGLDVSPRAVEIATRRARINGLEDRVRFVCGPIETVDLPAEAFDVVWCDAILHHLIPELDFVMGKLVGWAKPEGLLVFGEPIALSPTLRRLRLRLPIPVGGTPGERPLEPAEVDIVKAHLSDFRMSMFTILGRLDRFIWKGGYQGLAVPRKKLLDVVCAIDQLLLKLPGASALAATCVMVGHPRKPG